jgi:hypothetical protein
LVRLDGAGLLLWGHRPKYKYCGGEIMTSQKKRNPLRERAKTFKFIVPASNYDQDLILVDKLFDNRNLSMHAKVVGLYLAFCSHNHETWLLINAIAMKCKIGKSATYLAIQELKSQGFLNELGYRLDGEVSYNA